MLKTIGDSTDPCGTLYFRNQRVNQHDPSIAIWDLLPGRGAFIAAPCCPLPNPTDTPRRYHCRWYQKPQRSRNANRDTLPQSRSPLMLCIKVTKVVSIPQLGLKQIEIDLDNQYFPGIALAMWSPIRSITLPKDERFLYE